MFSVIIYSIIIGAPSLPQILRSHKSDKMTHHEYDKIYTDLFAIYRDEPITFLEIGVENGHSMASWSEYFTHPNTSIIGLAYKNNVTEQLKDERIFIMDGSQNDTSVQRKLADRGNYTIIIDDGSHVPSHQWNTFVALWPSVQSGGVYIIEDIETSYWSKRASVYGYIFTSEQSIMDKFKNMIDVEVNSEFSTGVDKTDVKSISFHRNCIILRKHDLGHKPRKYRFSRFLQGKKNF